MTQTTSDGLKLYVIHSRVRVSIRIIEKVYLLESAAGLSRRMTKSESASISTRENAVLISSDQRVNRATGYLFYLFSRPKNVHVIRSTSTEYSLKLFK
jgi:hypothetical protein